MPGTVNHVTSPHSPPSPDSDYTNIKGRHHNREYGQQLPTRRKYRAVVMERPKEGEGSLATLKGSRASEVMKTSQEEKHKLLATLITMQGFI